jgi:hypothetical protein
VNSSIATATATFRGTYNLVSDLSLTTSATQQQIAAALATKMTALSITPDNQDYAFVQIPTADATPTEIARIDRYKFNGSSWGFEYSLNNSGFTAAQWAAINSNLTNADKIKLDGLPNAEQLAIMFNGYYTKSEVDDLVVTHVVTKTPSDTTVTIEPNKLYVWSQPVSTLNVSFAAGQAGVVNEYMLQFATPQNTGTVLTLPQGVVWANDEELEPAPNYVYQVSIVNNLAIYAGWEAAPNE